MTKKIKYKEPTSYMPKEMRDKYFGEGKSTTKKSTPKKKTK